MTRLEKQFDIPIPLQDVEAQWQRVEARRNAEVRLGDVRGTGLSGAGAAGNPGARGAAAGAAGGTFAGGTGGTPGPGGGKPGTT